LLYNSHYYKNEHMLLASLNAITFNVTRFKVVSHTYHIIAANEEAQVDIFHFSPRQL